jgi:hypothetical protein
MTSEYSKAKAEQWWEWFCMAKFFRQGEDNIAVEAIEDLTKRFDRARREAMEESAQICEDYASEEENYDYVKHYREDRQYRAAGAENCAARIRAAKENAHKSLTRKLVPLKLNEEWREYIGGVPMPEGMRLETDEEFRIRIVSQKEST